MVYNYVKCTAISRSNLICGLSKYFTHEYSVLIAVFSRSQVYRHTIPEVDPRLGRNSVGYISSAKKIWCSTLGGTKCKRMYYG